MHIYHGSEVWEKKKETYRCFPALFVHRDAAIFWAALMLFLSFLL